MRPDDDSAFVGWVIRREPRFVLYVALFISMIVADRLVTLDWARFVLAALHTLLLIIVVLLIMPPWKWEDET